MGRSGVVWRKTIDKKGGSYGGSRLPKTKQNSSNQTQSIRPISRPITQKTHQSCVIDAFLVEGSCGKSNLIEDYETILDAKSLFE